MNEAAYRAILRRMGVEPVGAGDVVPAGPDPAELTRVLGLSLDQLDHVLEVRVPWLRVTLWFCPGDAEAEALLAEGVSRGRIWTAGELVDLLTIPTITKAGVRTLAEVKVAIDGTVETVRAQSVS